MQAHRKCWNSGQSWVRAAPGKEKLDHLCVCVCVKNVFVYVYVVKWVLRGAIYCGFRLWVVVMELGLLQKLV